MARWRFGLPAGLIFIGILLVLLSLRPQSPAPAPSPTSTAASIGLSTISATATTDIGQAATATQEAASIATSQHFVVPTATPRRSINNSSTTPTPRPTLVAGPIVSRTVTATASNTPRPAANTAAAITPGATTTAPIGNTPTTASPTSAPPAAGDGGSTPPSYLARFGVSGSMGDATAAALAGLPFGSYMNWATAIDPARPNGAQFWQMVRVGSGGLRLPGYDRIDQILAAQPGAVWIIGNEPDVIVQDNVTPERYAEIYHDLFQYIRDRDPTAKIAIAGVSQPTPLRRAYLDRVLSHYQATYGTPMPIDIWTVHGFILREEAGNWGAGIPPGMGVSQGTLYELGDHANMGIFQQNLLDFRAWMAGWGYGEHPLAVTEYGVVMPAEYGFPPELVQNFLVDSFNFFLSAAGGTGWSADGGRLFQYWFWYSLHDDFFSTPNLYNPDNNSLTPLGQRYATYVRGS